MKLLLLGLAATISLSSSFVFGQCCKGISSSLNITNQNRYADTGFNKNNLQSNLTIKGSVDLNGFVEIDAIIQSGNYNTGYNTIYNMTAGEFNKLDAATQIYLKKLYLKKVMLNGNLTASLGAMDNRNGISQTNSLSSAGWVDGARVELKTAVGLITMTAGQIKSSEPNSIDRIKNLNINYFELTMTRQIFDKLLIEGGLEFLNGKPLIEAASKYDIETATGKIIKLVADVNLDAKTGSTKFGVGIQDIISIFRTKPSPVKLAVNYEYISSKYNPEMNKLNNSMHTGYTGGAVVTSVQYPISKKLGINGFTNVRIGNQNSDFRFESGIVKTLFNKTSKKIGILNN